MSFFADNVTVFFAPCLVSNSVVRMTYGRVALSVQENQLTQDLELLMQVMDSSLQSLATLYSDFHYQGSTEETSTTQNSRLFTLERSVNAGRPRYEIRQEQIHGLREALRFRRVGRILDGVPRRIHSEVTERMRLTILSRSVSDKLEKL